MKDVASLAGAEPVVPVPMVNMISGGLHAGAQLDIQDVLVIPLAATSFRDALETVGPGALREHRGHRLG